MTREELRDALVNAYIATRTPAPKGTPDWARVRRSLECELFAKALPTILASLDTEAVKAETIEQCARVCEEQQAIFASEKYATGQPASSSGERFACGICAAAIRARKEQP